MPIVAKDPYKDFRRSPLEWARSGVAVTPSDTDDLVEVSQLYVGVAGDVRVILADDTVALTFKDFQGFFPPYVKRVMFTGTTATNILALP